MGILPTETLATIRTSVARAVNALETTGTVTGTITGTGFQSNDLKKYSSADALKGMELVIKTGTGAVSGNERRLNASTTGGAVTIVGPDFGTNPAAADTFDIYRPNVADLQLLNLAIKWAIELAQDWHMVDWEDHASIVLESVTANGGFEDWTSGTTSAPDGWVLTQSGTTAAVAREGTIILPPGRYSAKLTNENNKQATLQQRSESMIFPKSLWASKSIRISAWVYITTGSAQVTIRWSDDNGATWHASSAHGGTGWEKLTTTAATHQTGMAAEASGLVAELRIATGDPISCYVHDFRIVPSTGRVLEYYLPKRFLRLGEVSRENGNGFEYPIHMPLGAVWDVDRQQQRLVLKEFPPGEYRVKLVGQTYQAVPSADSDSIDLPLAYIIAAARSFLVAMGRCPDEMRKQAAQIHAEAYRLARQLHRQPMANSIRIR